MTTVSEICARMTTFGGRGIYCFEALLVTSKMDFHDTRAKWKFSSGTPPVAVDIRKISFPRDNFWEARRSTSGRRDTHRGRPPGDASSPYMPEGIVNFAGWVAGFMLLPLWASARDVFLWRWYDASVFAHIVSGVGFVLASNLHDYNSLMFAWLGLAVLLIDRLSRQFCLRDAVDGGTSTLEVRSIADGSVVGLTIDRPKSWALAPGAHVYLRDRSIGRTWHPVTISASDGGRGRVSFHVKARGDWTDAFVARWIARGDREQEATQSAPGRLEIEGLYGPDLSRAFARTGTACVFVAGGIGITGLSEAVQACAERGVPFAVVWLVHTWAEADALGAELLWNTRLFRSVVASNAPAEFRVYVTAEDGPGPVAPGAGLAESFARDEVRDHRHHRHRPAEEDLQSKQESKQDEVADAAQTKLLASTVSIVVLVSMALSFVAARQMCCAQPDPSTDHARTCGPAANSSSCRPCSMAEALRQDDVLDELPCCTIEYCYICFRALTVSFVMLLAPVVSTLVLRLLRRWRPKNASANDCCLLLARREGHRHYRSTVQEIVTIQDEDGSINWARLRAAAQETGQPLALTNGAPPATTSELVSVQYLRPDVGEVLRSLWKEHESDRTVSVLVCGPRRLEEGARREVDRQRSQDFVNRYNLVVM